MITKTKEHKPQVRESQVLFFLCSCALMLLCSCSRRMPSMFGQDYTPQASSGLNTPGSICLVELQNNTAYPQVSLDVTETLYQTLQKKNLPGLTMLRQSDSAWQNISLSPDSPYTLEELLATRSVLGSDAVMIGTVTSYSPYPHMAIGLHLKLIDLRDGMVAWSVEQVWDTADKATQQRIKKYFDRQLRHGFAPLDEQLATISSINFLRFVTYDATETLKPAGN